MAMESIGSETLFSPPPEFEEYRVVRLLGEGAMGRVYLAEDTLLRRFVAVKFVARRPNVQWRDQFFLEAQAVARLSHPNVVAIHRVGEVVGHPYLVSEYVRGQTLDRLARPVPLEKLLPVALGLARGLAAAHRRGVLHRDLKPTNVMLTDDGEVKLLDFGLARIVDDARPCSGEGVVGTPAYMAPEIAAGEPATRASDVYSMGIILGELFNGCQAHDQSPPSLGEVTVSAGHGFASIIDCCLSRRPTDRFQSGGALREALEDLSRRQGADPLPEGNPYRGLLPFDSAHRPFFFGRDAEAREIVERLRLDRFVVVCGESGAGKSSLCRAGVLPLAHERCGLRTLTLTPGRRPIAALSAALAELLAEPDFQWTDGRLLDPGPLLTGIRARAPGGLLLFVDQCEELLTVADPNEARGFVDVLGMLIERARGVSLLVAVRSDFLARLAGMDRIGGDVGRALLLLRPLSWDAMRDAIVGPARAKGVRFESESLVERLIASAHGGLPSLQFALAALWDRRDRASALIRSEALAEIGGVNGALARHADAVLDKLLPRERVAARRILCRLATAEGVRVRRSEAELVVGDPSARAALEGLVRGRLIIAHRDEDREEGAFEIAHEALLTSWDALRAWLAGDNEARALRHRVERAAAEWERLNKSSHALFNRAQLDEISLLSVGDFAPREAAFVAESRRSARRRRTVGMAIAVLPVFVLFATVLTIKWRTRREVASEIAVRTDKAAGLEREACGLQSRFEAARRDALTLFDTQHWAEGEEAWQNALAAARDLKELRVEASSILEQALVLAPSDRVVRGQLADLLYARILVAEGPCPREDASELSARLATYDDGGSRQERLREPGLLTIQTRPTNATVTMASYADQAGHRLPVHALALGRTPVGPITVSPGSYLLTIELPGRVTVRYPIVVARSERLSFSFTLPGDDALPAGFVYVPAGRFLFGSCAPEEVRRGFLKAEPLHEVTTGAYLIARTETTMGEWIDYLNDLPAPERRTRTPDAQSTRSSAQLRQEPSGRWRLSLRPTQHVYDALEGEPLRYLDRDRRVEQDWSRFPVSGISHDDIQAYAAWLDRTGRVPGARLCDEYEWERAARGADGRSFPSGERLEPEDADIDITYGRAPLAFGPDEVGAHVGSRSPFGIDDLAGNVWERVRSVARPDEIINRGGSWYQGELSSRSNNREAGEPTMRHPFLGVRLCARVPEP